MTKLPALANGPSRELFIYQWLSFLYWESQSLYNMIRKAFGLKN
jgi:hypothetical protein